MKAFQSNLSKLEGSNTQVLGVSMDSPFANHAFAAENGITFPLLGDTSGAAVKAYGLDKEYTIGGAKILSARRASFLVDKDGKIASIQSDNEAVDPTKIIDACDIAEHAKSK
jgi:peroxiredoxin